MGGVGYAEVVCFFDCINNSMFVFLREGCSRWGEICFSYVFGVVGE